MFSFTVALGVFVVAAILLSPLYIERLRVARSARIGTAFVIGSLGVAAVAVSGPARVVSNDALFLALFGLLLLGALLIMGDDPDEGYDDPDGDPPWWPEFEADLGKHLRRRSRPVGRRRTRRRSPAGTPY